MSHPLRLVLALHNHQPVGNFDGVFEQAYQDSYLPFLDLFESYEPLRIALHTSGPLMEWLDARHPEYLDRLRQLTAAGRVEIIGGAFFEPILTMISTRDRLGQIQDYTAWLEDRLGATIRGMWIPERVWEPSLTRDLADAGIEYTVLDDFHFKNAGLVDEELYGYFITEDEGRLLKVFPGSERLRYLIPFDDPERTIEYLAAIHQSQPGAVVVFGDDGEKFGTWPETKKHVYDNGWLARLFDLLVAEREWIASTTLAEAADHTPPAGTIYLPDSSYREMTEWSLPASRQVEYDALKHELEGDPRWERIKPFVRGGLWRNFKVRYPEANEMYARMMMVSRKLAERVEQGGSENGRLGLARRELYRGQCNCAYWHGAFGGVYLPHLRNAVYSRLIAADNLLEQAAGREDSWVEAVAGDYNLDDRPELLLSNDRLAALIAPSRGGMLYELDIRSICHNLLATMGRRPEAYHRRILAGAKRGADQVSSIHDRVIFKQEGLDRRLQYDTHPRKSLLDQFFDRETPLEAVAAGEAEQHGDFWRGAYEARLRRAPSRVQAVLSRQAKAWEMLITITKTVTLAAGSSILDVAYQLEGLPRGCHALFAVEMNFAGMPAGADDRYFHDPSGNRLGQLGTRLDLLDVDGLRLTDEWLGLEAGLGFDRPTHVWTYPIETVSQSEGGFELVHQSVVVQPHWFIDPDASGRWQVNFHLALDTSRADAQRRHSPTARRNAMAT